MSYINRINRQISENYAPSFKNTIVIDRRVYAVVVVPGLVHVTRYKLVARLHEPTEKRICASLNAQKNLGRYEYQPIAPKLNAKTVRMTIVSVYLPHSSYRVKY